MASSAISTMAQVIKPDPTLDIAAAFKQIEDARQAQLGAVNQFGQTQDTNLQNDYSQLQSGLKSSIGAQAQNYQTGAQNIRGTYDNAANIQGAADAQTQMGINEAAARMGLDSRATSQVQGDLAKQANIFQLRNQQSESGRVSSMQELGAKMGAVAQLGVQAAQQAEAQGRRDLTQKIATELQRVQTAATQAQADFTGVKTQQLYRQTLQAEAQLKQAAAQLAAQQRAAQSQAIAMARLQQAQANSDRNYNLAMQRFQASQGKPSALDTWIAEQQYSAQNPKINSGQQSYDAIYGKAQQDFGGAGRAMLDQLLAGIPAAIAQKNVSNVPWFAGSKGRGVQNNLNDILSVYSRLKNTNRSG